MSFLSPLPTRLGMVCLARRTFEADLAEQWYAEAQECLRSLDKVELGAVEQLVVESTDADAAIQALTDHNIDALVILNGTFALGGLAMRLAQAIDKPLLLWAWPEPDEQTGKLRLNSLVGATVNASNLYKLGHRPTTLYASRQDAGAIDTIARFARIAGILRDIKRTRIALIGGHAPGFDNLGVDKLSLRRALGVEVVDVGLQTIVTRAQAVSVERIHSVSPGLLGQFQDTVELTGQQGELFTALAVALVEFAKENQLDALAIKCWGDLADMYGIAGCGVASIMNDSGLLTGCEGDIMGTLTSLIAGRLTGTPPFLTDLVSVERENNTAFLWHIGCAAVCLANSEQPRHLHSHFAGGKGVTAGFALKPGRVTLLRLGDDGHHLRMLATTGTALETEMEMRGTVSRVRFDKSAGAFLDEMLANGWEHHLVMAYGDITADLAMLASALQVPLTLK